MTENIQNNVCPNCWNEFRSEDKYCSECGQNKLEKKDYSVRKLFAESFGDFFHFDSKFMHSLIPLFLKPGYLTIEFMKGRRKMYFQPFKMLLFISVFYFILTGLDLGSYFNHKQPKPFAPDIRLELGKEFDKTVDSLKNMAPDSMKKTIKEKGIDNIFKIDSNTNWFDRYIFKLAVKFNLNGREKVFEEFYHYISKLIFLLLPLFALLLKLLYVRRKRTYFEHLVFSLHFHSLVFILFIITEFISLFDNNIQYFILPIIFIYLFVALKKVYRQRIFKTLLKNSILFISYLIFIGIFLFLVTIVTLEML